jgi:glycosyltransferase involved in cell wall biosynthesis
MSINPTVIVTTYNKPHELDLVLCGLAQQKVFPHEILVADDGSSAETAVIIKRWSSLIQAPVTHVWHEDLGNRKSIICDLAVSKAQGDYLIFLDGDSIPHPMWVNDHIEAASQNTVLCGRRVRLGKKISSEIDVNFIQTGKLHSPFGPLLSSSLQRDSKRYSLGIRLPKLLARSLHPRERRLMGVNFSLPRVLYEKVGGYSNINNKILPSLERRREDAQLEIRLLTAGAKRFPLLNRAIVYHLYHDERPANDEINNEIQIQYESALAIRKAGSRK